MVILKWKTFDVINISGVAALTVRYSYLVHVDESTIHMSFLFINLRFTSIVHSYPYFVSLLWLVQCHVILNIRGP